MIEHVGILEMTWIMSVENGKKVRTWGASWFLVVYLDLTFDSGCWPGWTRFRGNCYKFFDQKKVWSDARAYCMSLQVIIIIMITIIILNLPWFWFIVIHPKADLVTIHSEEEHRFVANLGTGKRSIWLNGRKIDGKWQWADGSSWSYQNWAPHQPSGDGTCMEIIPSSPPKWNDRGCNDLSHDMDFVCKKWLDNFLK